MADEMRDKAINMLSGADRGSYEAKATTGVGFAILALADAITQAAKLIATPRWEQQPGPVSDPTRVEN